MSPTAPRAGWTEEEVSHLDRVAARALPAETVLGLDGWELRHSAALPFRRANSVLALDGPRELTDAALDARVDAVQAFYRDHGLPARVQVTPASRPTGLDDALARRRFRVEAPVTIMTGPASGVPADPAARVALVGVDHEWTGRLQSVHADDAHARERVLAFARMLRRVDAPWAAALALDAQDRPVALGFAIAEGEWAGVFGMSTAGKARRHGHARAVLGRLARWAVTADAPRLYLQVETDNEAARALYASSGLTDAYGYHYRTRD